MSATRLLFPLSILVLFLTVSPALGQAVVEGTVTSGGEPLPGANIRVEGTSQEAAADADGRYRIADLEPGAHTLIASAVGFETIRKEVTLRAGDPRQLDFSLEIRSSRAQAPAELITDRPDFTESPAVVPVGHVQVETGVIWTRRADANIVGGPEALLRWTPFPSVELRLTVPSYVRTSGMSGFGDSALGAKVELGGLAGWDFATIATVSVPTGGAAFSSGSVDPELLVTAGRDLGRGGSVGTQISGGWKSGVDRAIFGSTIVVGTELGERTGTFLELAVATTQDDPASVILHHGYTFAAGRFTQIDLHVGLGLTNASPDVLVGVGWSRRF